MHISRASFLILTSFPSIRANTDCSKDTGGTCHVLDCDPSRGPTTCGGIIDGGCYCQPDYCAADGSCYPETTTTTTSTPRKTSSNCAKAWEKKCFSKPPFKDSCGSCATPKAISECCWGYSPPCCPDLLEKTCFSFDPSNDACVRACNKLGNKTNEYSDYCPDEKLSKDEDIQTCQPAKWSLLFSQTKSQSFCSSQQGNLTCNWQFCFWENFGKNHTCYGGGFNSSPTCHREDFLKACDALGNDSNIPRDYCNPNMDRLKSVEQCQPAKDSFEQNRALRCAAGEKLLGSSPVGRSKVVPSVKAPERKLSQVHESSDDKFCDDAFKIDSCLLEAPFNGCCRQENKSLNVNCTWSYSLTDGSEFGTGAKKSSKPLSCYPLKSQIGECDSLDLCTWLGDPNRKPADFCGGCNCAHVRCFGYWGLGMAPWCEKDYPPSASANSKWCTNEQNFAASPSAGPKTRGFTFWVAAGAFLMVAMASLAAKVKSRLRHGDDGHARLLGGPRMALS